MDVPDLWFLVGLARDDHEPRAIRVEHVDDDAVLDVRRIDVRLARRSARALLHLPAIVVGRNIDLEAIDPHVGDALAQQAEQIRLDGEIPHANQRRDVGPTMFPNPKSHPVCMKTREHAQVQIAELDVAVQPFREGADDAVTECVRGERNGGDEQNREDDERRAQRDRNPNRPPDVRHAP